MGREFLFSFLTFLALRDLPRQQLSFPDISEVSAIAFTPFVSILPYMRPPARLLHFNFLNSL
jgi:hypothetical protein